MWSQELLPSRNRTINEYFVGCAIFHRVVEGIIEANTTRKPRVVKQERRAHFILGEKSPLRSLIVSAQASLISVIKDISRSGLSPMSHVHASIPAAIELGVKATNGSATSS